MSARNSLEYRNGKKYIESSIGLLKQVIKDLEDMLNAYENYYSALDEMQTNEDCDTILLDVALANLRESAMNIYGIPYVIDEYLNAALDVARFVLRQ
ncbi:MAG: hypothetical protein QXS68_02955 [Candidatus Methanomethylicaceae archaeon]